MAETKRARVVKIQQWQADVCHLTCAMAEPSSLGFKGGQYIIINSGKLLANGKLGKRAYSILSMDNQQDHFELAIKKIVNGIGSNFMHDLKVGDTFEFSGPWGQYHSGHLVQEERVLCIATDTGVTAALGLFRSQVLKPFLGMSKLLWFVSSKNYFIPTDLVPADTILCPMVKDESRIPFILEQVQHFVGQKVFTKIYLSGDGIVLRTLKEQLLATGQYVQEQVFVESFFHHESLKTAATART